ncbi:MULTISPECIES: hypothetical protein [Flammeovirga]|uniref:Uncharacterized protein n=1 Tax=Flammeovirga agarivorans TaxID=2726742 RepID=A0A7X8SGE3_9BACT|nr:MULTISPECIES: hypothetical protein [Flammeovirga]NLR89740.1 hypothetical protein [Flammeovirga agarivorans]
MTTTVKSSSEREKAIKRLKSDLHKWRKYERASAWLKEQMLQWEINNA